MASSAERLEGDDYFLEEGETDNEVVQVSKRRSRFAIVAAVIFATAALALTLDVLTRNSSTESDTIYTVDSSTYGVPDECEDITAFCAESKETGVVQCSCGDYLYQWDEYSGEWVLYNASGNDGER